MKSTHRTAEASALLAFLVLFQGCWSYRHTAFTNISSRQDRIETKYKYSPREPLKSVYGEWVPVYVNSKSQPGVFDYQGIPVLLSGQVNKQYYTRHDERLVFLTVITGGLFPTHLMDWEDGDIDILKAHNGEKIASFKVFDCREAGFGLWALFKGWLFKDHMEPPEDYVGCPMFPDPESATAAAVAVKLKEAEDRGFMSDSSQRLRPFVEENLAMAVEKARTENRWNKFKSSPFTVLKCREMPGNESVVEFSVKINKYGSNALLTAVREGMINAVERYDYAMSLTGDSYIGGKYIDFSFDGGIVQGKISRMPRPADLNKKGR